MKKLTPATSPANSDVKGLLPSPDAALEPYIYRTEQLSRLKRYLKTRSSNPKLEVYLCDEKETDEGEVYLHNGELQFQSNAPDSAPVPLETILNMGNYLVVKEIAPDNWRDALYIRLMQEFHMGMFSAVSNVYSRSKGDPSQGNDKPNTPLLGNGPNFKMQE